LQSQHGNGLETKTLGTKSSTLSLGLLDINLLIAYLQMWLIIQQLLYLEQTEVSDCSQVNIYSTLIGSYTITNSLNNKTFHHTTF